MDIVASSLYSDKEVFVRELISNASDALEKLKYMQVSGSSIADAEKELSIKINIDAEKKLFSIEDSGIGMTKEELIENLGTIARSGSKAFIAKMKTTAGEGASVAKDSIIGQFGVGFYAGFMVGNRIAVTSQSYEASAASHSWLSDGMGEFEVSETEKQTRGTTITIHLKDDCLTYADPAFVRNVIKKYSNFISFPIYVNGEQVNTVRPLWTVPASEIKEEDHIQFYRLISNAFDKPMLTLNYRTDAPINIRSLIYVPEMQQEKFGFGQMEHGVSLYCRKVLIKAKDENLVPQWLRFLRGVVDSEDIPLNISREFLKDSSVLKKLKDILTSRVLRFFQDESKANPEKYARFFDEYSVFFREGILSSEEYKTDLMKLMLFESSTMDSGKRTTVAEYISRMGDRSEIYYLCSPSRQLALDSPYLEAFAESKTEVLFMYDMLDDVVMSRITEFMGKRFVSLDSNDVRPKDEPEKPLDRLGKLSVDDEVAMRVWLKDVLGPGRVVDVKGSTRLASTPAIVVNAMNPTMARFMKQRNKEFSVLPVEMEINPGHNVIKKLFEARKTNPEQAKMIAEQLFDNALISAGIHDEPRTMVSRLNRILELALGGSQHPLGVKTSASGKIILPS